MKLRRFYTTQQLTHPGQIIDLSGQAEHIGAVLRLRVGTVVEVFDGHVAATAKLQAVASKQIQAEVVQIQREDLADGATQKFELQLNLALIKPTNFELAVQKCTELGVSSVRPILTNYTQQRGLLAQAKSPRWHKIMVEACQQSGRTQVPELLEVLEFSELAAQLADFDLVLILHPQAEAYLHQISAKLSDSASIALVIGPEGGFSPAEVTQAQKLGWQSVRMATHILRSETAAIAACSILSFLKS